MRGKAPSNMNNVAFSSPGARQAVGLRCNVAARRGQALCRRPGVRAAQAAAQEPGRRVAEVAVAQFVGDDTLVGVGPGNICAQIIQELGRRLDAGSLKNVRILAASDSAASEAAFVGVPLAPFADHDKVDVFFAEVDEVDVTHPKLAFIFGRQREPVQPQIPRFRVVAQKAKSFVALLSSDEQAVSRLGHELPVVVEGEDWENIAEEIDDIFIGDAEVWRRPATGTASPRADEDPYVSPEGHNLLDVRFGDSLALTGDTSVEYDSIETELYAVEGVVAVALMQDIIDAVMIQSASNEPRIFTKEQLTGANVESS